MADRSRFGGWIFGRDAAEGAAGADDDGDEEDLDAGVVAGQEPNKRWTLKSTTRQRPQCNWK